MEGKINNYNNGKIYFLMNNINHEIFYIGSTVKTLTVRLKNHKYDAFNFNSRCYDGYKCNYIRLMNINDSSGYNNNISIHLIENYQCDSKDELLYRERYWIQSIGPSTNNILPIISKNERNIYRKKYFQDNKEKIKEKRKIYMEKNGEKIRAKGIQYIKNHKEEIKKRASKKIKCDCGEYIRLDSKSRHQRTQLHRDIMRMNELD